MSPSATALLVIDMIYGCVDAHLGYIAAAGEDPETSYYARRMEAEVVPNHERLLTAFNAAGATIVYTVLGAEFPDYREMSPGVRPVIETRGVHRGTRGFEILDRLQPRPTDYVITKLGSGAFETTEVDDLLRASGVDAVVITGTVTNGCVLTTALGAWDRGYRVTVVDDACCTLGARPHDVALQVMADCGIDIAETDAVLARLEAPVVAGRG